MANESSGNDPGQQTNQSNQNNQNIQKAKAELVDQVINRVQNYTKNGAFLIPPDYAMENAVRAAYFIIGETVDKDKVPALQVCTDASIGEAMFRMTMQGLDPVKNQCYFIVNGNKLSLRRSYMGAIAVAERVAKLKDISYQVVHRGDDFAYEIINGKIRNIEHKQSLENIDNEIIGAYAICKFEGEKEDYIDVMTKKQINESWKMSAIKNNNQLQSNFGVEAAKRTIINRTLKPVINTSTDANIYQRDLTEENEVEDADHEVVTSQQPTQTIALPEATAKQTVPAQTKPKAEAVPVNPPSQPVQQKVEQVDKTTGEITSNVAPDPTDPATW